MKRMKLFLGVFALVAMSLTSCKKDYDCVCTFPDGSQEVGKIENKSKSDAEKECEEADAIASIAGGSCELD